MVTIEHVLKIQIYLAAMIGMIPVLPFLQPWVLTTVTAALGLGLFSDIKRLTIIPERLCTFASIVFFILLITRVSFANLATPLIEFLCLLLAVRLAGPKSSRYMLQTFLLSSIILAGSSMLTLESAYLVYLVLMILIVTTGLVLLSFYVTDPTIQFSTDSWRQLMKVALLLPAGSLLLMVFFFVILPRTQTPLWNFLNPAAKAAPGISDRVQPGTVVNLTANDAAAFRAETEQIPSASLYWRTVVFGRIEGQTWRQDSTATREKLVKSSAKGLKITFYTEPKTGRYLPTLDRAVAILDAPRRSMELRDDGTLQLRRPSSKKFRYETEIQPEASWYLHGDKEKYLQVPGHLTQRVRQLGQQIAQEGSFKGKTAKLDQLFQNQRLNYAATQLPKTEDPVDTFLFESRRGYCEYFASSYALLLRLGGVPTRLIGGYLGGEYNALGGYYLISQDQAHVWVEALDDEGRWQRIDPSRLAINSDEALQNTRAARITTLTAMIDLLEHHWSRFVLNYDLRQQFSLLRSLTLSLKDIGSIKPEPVTIAPWFGVAICLPLLWLWFYFHKTRNKRLLRKFLKLVGRQQGPKELPPSTGLFDLAEQVDEPLCREFARIYGEAVYRDRRLTAAEQRQLKRIVHQLQSKWSKRG